MKSYNHLWEQFITDSNIELAIHNASLGKRDRNSVKRRLEDPSFNHKVKYYATHFRNRHHVPKEIYDGIQRKKRTIIVPTFEEQVVHHMVVNVLKPIFMHGMYEHSYGSIPGRGSHKGKKVIEKWIRNDPKNCKYVLKMDIRKYFDSISHEILIRKLRLIIHDEQFMDILEEIINAIPNGIPLGFYTSQWFANWYLQGLDHYIKEKLGAKHYIRYMDDMVIFDSSKKRLHKMRKTIEEYLFYSLGLTLKDNWQVFRFDFFGKYRFLDFMGFRFYRNRTTLRKSIMLKMTRKAKHIFKKGEINAYVSRQMLSYLGWIKHTNSYSMYLDHIKPLISFQELKATIGNYDRERNRRLTYGLV